MFDYSQYHYDYNNHAPLNISAAAPIDRLEELRRQVIIPLQQRVSAIYNEKSALDQQLNQITRHVQTLENRVSLLNQRLTSLGILAPPPKMLPQGPLPQ